MEVSSAVAPEQRKRRMLKYAVFGLLATALAYVYLGHGDKLNRQYLSEQQAALDQFRDENPVLVYGGAFVLYVAVTALSLPIAAPLSLIYGWYFPLWKALLLVSFASTSGATISFLLSRYLFRDALQSKFAERLQGFNQALEREGPFYLFTLRLIPAIPFWLINIVMGLTSIRVWTFFWVSQLGMLPGTIVYLYAGSQLPDLSALVNTKATEILTPGLIAAFVLLAIFPFVVRAAVSRLRSQKPGPVD